MISIRSFIRSLRKNWLYGSLNILGLTLAYSCLILVATYLFHETTFESFHHQADRIYRATYHMKSASDFDVHWARVPEDFINQLPADIPEIQKLIRFDNQEQRYLRVGENRIRPKHAYVTDADIFEVFDYRLIAGDKSSALAKPHSMVLTTSMAERLFGSKEVIGKEVMISRDWSAVEVPYQVTGMIEDVPSNTHMPVELFLSYDDEAARTGWAYTYIMLKEGATIGEVEGKMTDFVAKYTDPEATMAVDIQFQPLSSIHLQSHLAREIKPNGQKLYVKIFFWAGIFIWLIALVNFSNLSAALALDKGKEVGVRKILGAKQGQLVMTAFAETLCYSLVALLVASIIAYLAMPAFSHLTGTSNLISLKLLGVIVIPVALLNGIVAGILPATIMLGINVLTVLKKGNKWSMKGSSRGLNLKKVMITIQFGATIILIASAFIAQRQFHYINEKNLGIDIDQVLAIPRLPGQVQEGYAAFKNRVKQIPGVKGVAACMEVPSREIRDSGPVLVKGQNLEVNQAPLMDIQVVDPDFVDLLDLELLAGSDFTRDVRLSEPPTFNEEYSPAEYLATNPRKYLINETAMFKLGWTNPEEAIGQEIKWSIGSFELAYGPIAGVIKDYHQETLKNKVDPIVMTVEPIWLSNFLIKVDTRDLATTLAGITGVWADMFPYALEYDFLDELFSRLYANDRMQWQLLILLASLAMIIAFIGLISLVAYALQTRAKELAIRRVVGARLLDLTKLMGKEYFWYVSIAALIAIPISYKIVVTWLQNFAYQIKVSPVYYLLAIAAVFALLFVTVGLQTLTATGNQPIKALRED
jgi:putative ABC transport system permease protein